MDPEQPGIYSQVDQPVYFVADLHMFAKRSQTERYHQRIRQVAALAKTIVLGGDVFDFRWTTLPSVPETVHAARLWLEELLNDYPDCALYYVLGNHDFHPLLMEELADLDKQYRQFHWHKYWMQLGRSLFLHGDVADRLMAHEELVKRRHRWSTDHRPAARYRHHLYDAAIHLRLHTIASRVVFPPTRVLQRIHHYCTQQPGLDWNAIENLYFGHTHVEVDGVCYKDVTFHNGGAPMKGMPFRVIEAEL